MSVSLKKGQKVSLTKKPTGQDTGLSKVVVGLGWDEAPRKSGGLLSALFGGGGASIDCDASAFVLKDGKLVGTNDIVYFGNKSHSSGTIQHMGDNLTGAGAGDDEQIVIDLSRVPAQYDRIVFVVNIYQATQRKQSFGMIRNAFIRIVDGKTKEEFLKYNLTDDYAGMTALIFGEVYRHNGEWKFNAVGQGTTDPDLRALANRYI